MQGEHQVDTVELFAARNPLSPAIRHDLAPGDLSIAELIAFAVEKGAFGPTDTAEQVELVKDDLRDLRVYVDGESLPFATPEEQAATLSLVAPAGSIVNLQVEPLGGSNGTARALVNIFYQIGAVVASAFFGPLVGAVVSISGSLISNALFPIRKPDSLASANDRGALSSQANSIRKRGMMPLQLGAERVAPDVAANAYSTNRGGDVWLTVIFGWHYGPCSVADIKIGETLLADYPAGDVIVEHALLPGPRNFTIYAQSPNQENLQDELDLGGDWEVHTTELVCNRVEVDVTWPQGLRFNKPNGAILNQEIRTEIQWAPVGTDDWEPAPLDGAPHYSRLGSVLPEGVVETAGQTQDPVRRTFGWTKGDDDQVKVRMRAWDPDADDPNKAVQATFWTALRSIAFKKPIVDENLACTAISIKSSDDLGGTLPVITGVVTPYAPVWTGTEWQDDIADWAPTSNMAAMARMMLMGPGAAVPVTSEHFDASCEDAYELIEANNWKGAYRLDREVTQNDALKIMGLIGRFSVYDVGEGLCFVTDWSKPVARQIFTGRNVQGYSLTRVFPKPVHGAIVEYNNIDEDSRGDELIVYADDHTEETATLLEACSLEWSCTDARAYKEGRAWLTRRILGVETHQWTAGPDAIASSYGARVRVTHPTSLFGQGAARVLMRHMAGGLVVGVRLDDVIEMVEDVDYSMDVRRVDRVIEGLAVVTTPGRTNDLMFPVGLTEANAPEADDLIAFGKVNLITEDLEIVDFEPDGDGVKITARRYLGEELEDAETGTIPDLQTRLTPTPRAPQPRSVGIVSATPEGVRVAFDVDTVRGALIECFPVRWRRSADPANTWNTLQPLAATQRVASTPPILDAANPTGDSEGVYAVDIEIRSKLRNGDLSDALVIEAIQIGRAVEPPTSVIALGLVRADTDGSTYPVLAVSCAAVTSGLVTDLVVQVKIHGTSDSTYRSAGEPLLASNPSGDYTSISGGRTYDVRLAWRTYDGWLSDPVIVTSVAIPAGARMASGLDGVSAAAVVDTLKTSALTVAAEALRQGFWRIENDEITKIAGGATMRLLQEQLGTTVDGVKTFVDFQRSVDSDGNAMWALTAQNSTGGVTGIRNLLTGESIGKLQMVADILEIVDPDGGNPRFILRYGLDNRLILTDVYIENLEVASVKTESIDLRQVNESKVWEASLEGERGVNLGAGSSGVWAHFGLSGNKASITYPDLPEGTEINLRMFVNGSQQAGDDDTIWWRLKQIDPDEVVTYNPRVLKSSLVGKPQVICWEWRQDIAASGSYTFQLEYYRYDGEGLYYECQLIADAGKR
jgi:hypothetical protein